jgi:predicted nucleic acid-binding protein
MKTLYLRNVPDEVIEQLRRLAASDGLSLNAVAVRELAQVSQRANNALLLGTLPNLDISTADLDASVAVSALLVDGPARVEIASQQLHAPHLIDSEVLQVLRRREHSAPEASATALRVWEQLSIIRYPSCGYLGRIWQLRNNLTAYDASYVALAELLGTALLTADARISRAPGISCPVVLLPAH